MNTSESNTAWLSKWYFNHCDGDWEHSERIQIYTIDNPGWRLSINLEDTVYEDKPFSSIEVENSKDDWMQCFIRNKRFEGACGPLNFEKMLLIFKEWIEKK